MIDREKPVLFGIDRAAAIRPDELPKLRDVLGPIDWVAVYIGGIRSAGSGWTLDALKALHRAQPDLGFLPIYVGRNAPWDQWDAFSAGQGFDDARGALALMESRSLLDFDGSCCLDIEAQTWDGAVGDLQDNVKAYIRAWCHEVGTFGLTPVVYGPLRCCAWLQAEMPEVKTWVAYWQHTGPNWLKLTDAQRPVLQLTIGGMQRTPDAWQFVGGVPVAGEVDCNISSNDFPLVEWEASSEDEEWEPTVHDEPAVPQDVPGVEVAPGRDLPGEVNSLAGSASELYARVGRLEAIVSDWAGRLNLPLPVQEAPAEPE